MMPIICECMQYNILYFTGTKVAEVYAFGYAHCQFMVRYQAVAVDPPDALTYFSLSANDGSNTDGIIRRVGGDLSAASNRVSFVCMH